MDARVPFSAFHSRVLPEWIDYNGHMNVAHYVMAFDQATDLFLDNLTIGADYARSAAHSAFVVDMNVGYRRELLENAPFYVTTQLLGFDSKKMRIFHQMFHRDEGFLAATNELLLIHVSMETRRSSPFPPKALEQLKEMARQHRSLAMPDGAGRVLGL